VCSKLLTILLRSLIVNKSGQTFDYSHSSRNVRKAPRTVQVASAPADLDRPSFLKLPAEIRNSVYEHLLRSQGSTTLELDRWDPKWRVVSRPIVPNVVFLATCRQMYSEAIGVLYCQNTFEFTMESSRTRDAWFENVSNWLTGIGRHASLLGTLLIDMSDIQAWPLNINILPLLRHLWKHKTSRLGIKFTSRHESVCTPAEAERLGAVMTHLVVDTFPELQVYDESGLLRQVRIVPWENTGWICFGVPLDGIRYAWHDDYPLTYDHKFRITTTGISLKASLTPDPGNWVENPSICQGIPSRLAQDTTGFVFDLTRKTLSPKPCTLGQVNENFRRLTQELVRLERKVAKITTSQRKIASLNEVALIKEFGRTNHNLPDPSSTSLPFAIFIRFELDGQASLEEVRIDATAIVDATEYYDNSTTIRVELHNSKRTGSPIDESTLQLADIRSRVLIALHVICEEDACRTKVKQTVWIDGKGVARETEVTNGEDGTSVWTHSKITTSDMAIRDMAQDITHKYLWWPGSDSEQDDAMSRLARYSTFLRNGPRRW
jgi:hypothetical protein